MSNTFSARKKLAALSIVIILLMLVLAKVTLSYFTATSQAVNTFTYGSVTIKQEEKDENGDFFQQEQTLLPIVDPANPTDDENYIHKVVTVTNESTTDTSVFVRTWVAIPKVLFEQDLLHLDIDCKPTNTSSSWQYIADRCTEVTENGIVYIAFPYDYQLAVGAGETTDASLKGVYLDAEADIAKVGDSYQLVRRHTEADGTVTTTNSGYVVDPADPVDKLVLVLSQAVQASGDDITALLDAAFPADPDWTM